MGRVLCKAEYDDRRVSKEKDSRKKNERLLVAVTLTEEGGELVIWALTCAARSGDMVTIVHVTEPYRPPSSLIVSSSEVLERMEMQKTQEMLNTLSVLVSHCRRHFVFPQLSICLQVVESESVNRAIVEEARNLRATLVIIGKSSSQGMTNDGHHVFSKRMPELGKLCVKNLSPYCHILTVRKGKVLVRRPGTASRRRSLETLLVEEAEHEHPLTDASSDRLHYLDQEFDAEEPRAPDSQSSTASSELSEERVCTPTSGHLRSGSSSFESVSPKSVLASRNTNSSSETLDDCSSPPFATEPELFSSTSPLSSRFSSSGPYLSDGELLRFVAPQARVSEAGVIREERGYREEFNFSFSPPHFARTYSESKYELTEEGLLRLQEDVRKELPTVRKFTYHELRLATNNFAPEHVVGTGASCTVYRAQLRDGSWAAIKLLGSNKHNNIKAGEKEFMMEIMMLICALYHPNIVTLVGFSTGGPRRLLVYEFLARGSLHQNLHGMHSKLNWSRRQKIAFGVSRGLAYLHSFSPRPIIHRDIKSSNILLGDDFEAQISDFGLARWLSIEDESFGGEDGRVSCAGTFGYMAPECFMFGAYDERSDVYAFGVVLLELMSGKKPIDYTLCSTVGDARQSGSLVQWARNLQREGRTHLLVDQSLKDINAQQFKRMMNTALMCIQLSPDDRPSMDRVVRLLDPDSDYSPRCLASSLSPTF